jgi:cupin 2 domain-containing protein
VRAGGNLFADVGPARADATETFTPIVAGQSMRVERIVSHGHASPAGFWYDQEESEWVVVLAGSAGVLIEGQAEPVTLRRGDYLAIPARTRHRVAWTDPGEPTVWLAVHYR